MSLFSSFAKKLNSLNSRFNTVVRLANRASNIERQVKSVARESKTAVKKNSIKIPARMPGSKR